MSATSTPLDFNAIMDMFRAGPTEQERQQASAYALARAGLGILSANQPSPYPRSSLGVLAQGSLGGLDAFQNQLKFQMDERKAGGAAALQAMQFKRLLDQQEALKNFDQAPQGAAPATAGPAQAGMSPTTSQAAFGSPDFASANVPASPAQPPLQVPNFRGLLAAGVDPKIVNSMMEDFKLRNPKLENVPGIGMVHPYTAAVQSSMPRITDTGRAAGAVPDGRGGWRIQVPEGSLGAYGQFQNVDEMAKARFDPFMGQVDPSGRPIPQTRLQFAGRMSPEAVAPGVSPSGTGMGPTPAERAAAEHLGAGVGTQATKVMTDAASSALQLREIDQISTLTQGLNTGKLEPFKIGVGQWIIGSGLESPEWVKKNITDVPRAEAVIGAVNKMVAVAVRQTDAQPAVRQIDMLRKSYPGVMQTQEGLLLLTGILRDAHVYNIEKLREQQKFIAAGGKLSDFESHWTEVAKQMPLFKNFPQAAPIPKEPGQPPTVMTDKPPAAQHKGRIIEDESGKRFRSDGMSWKPL